MDIKSLIHQYRQIKPDAVWSQQNRAKLADIYQAEGAEAQRRSADFSFEQNYSFLNLIQNLKSKIQNFSPVPVIIGLVFVIFITGLGLVSASRNSLPGDFLYSIKRASEQTKMAMTVDKSKRAVLRAEILDHRLGEAKILEETNSPLLKTAAQDFQNELSNFKNDVNILASKSDLPIEDKKEIIPYIGNAEEVKKVLAETKELLSQKNLEVALENITYLENISTTSTIPTTSPTSTEESADLTEVSTTSTEENVTSTPSEKPSSLRKIKDLKAGSIGSLKGGMILEPEKTGVETDMQKENE